MQATTSAEHSIRQEHAAVAAVIRRLQRLAAEGPGGDAAGFFDTVARLLFYLDEFPERRHHRMESDLLFPMLLEAAPEMRAVIQRLEMDHAVGEARARELQHLLRGWQFLGEPRKEKFERALDDYARFYLQHMKVEEAELLPLVEARLGAAQKARLDAAFEEALDPLVGGKADAVYARLIEEVARLARPAA